MAKIVISDTDFLSSFLKIKRLSLILKAFQIKKLLIPQAVAHELRRSTLGDLLQSALATKKIIIQEIKVHSVKGFGLGEIEAIALAEKTKGILLMDDRKASPYALTKGITAITLPDFLSYCKENAFLGRKEIRSILDELEKEDYYLFSKEVMEILLD